MSNKNIPRLILPIEHDYVSNDEYSPRCKYCGNCGCFGDGVLATIGVAVTFIKNTHQQTKYFCIECCNNNNYNNKPIQTKNVVRYENNSFKNKCELCNNELINFEDSIIKNNTITCQQIFENPEIYQI